MILLLLKNILIYVFNACRPPAILGVTNPFFAKTLQHWPNIVRIGEYTSMSPKKRISPKVGNLIKSSSNSFDSTPGKNKISFEQFIDSVLYIV